MEQRARGLVDYAVEDTPATILIVDDARLNREVLVRALKPFGHKFLSAANGREAIDVLRAHPEVELILLDLVMPGMDGFEFLRWRAGQEDVREIPVIVNSSLDDFDSIARALRMQAYDYFTKPLSTQELEVVLPLKIRNAVAARRLLVEIRRRSERMARELEMAGRYQRLLLPRRTRLPGLELAYTFRPCHSVGGDYFDLFRLEKAEVGVVVADVSGHGPAAAMTASIVKALLPGFLREGRGPARALKELNDELVELTPEEGFVTAFAGVYSIARRRFTWASAGHPPALALSPREGLKRLESSGVMLGMFESSGGVFSVEEQELELVRGQRLVLYTDGLIEAEGEGGQLFGLGRLEGIVERCREMAPRGVVRVVEAELERFTGGEELADDMALIVVDFVG